MWEDPKSKHTWMALLCVASPSVVTSRPARSHGRSRTLSQQQSTTTNLTRPTARCGIIITPSVDNRHEPDWVSHWNGLRMFLYLLVLDGPLETV